VSAQLLYVLAVKSAGVAIGTGIGVAIGLGLRKREGKTEWLLGGSVALTAVVAGLLALLLSMVIRYFTGI